VGKPPSTLSEFSASRRRAESARVPGLSAEQLLRFPVRLEGLDVGRAVDVILDPGHGRALGLDILCHDEVHRFLPLAAADVDGDVIKLSSAFALVDDSGFEFYRGRTSSLRMLKGTNVARAGRDLGALRDVVVSSAGDIEAFVVEAENGAERVPVGPGVQLDDNGR
jgi:hypothetical protein